MKPYPGMLKVWEVSRKTLRSKIPSGNISWKLSCFKKQKKKVEVNQRCLFSIWGNRSLEWISSPAEGSAGGKLTGWKADLFEVLQVEFGIFPLSVKLRNKQEGFRGGYPAFMVLHSTPTNMNFGLI